jgi:hypothetical protein
MTPQQKAIELLTKYRRHLPVNTVTDLEAKVCALIAVDEIMKYLTTSEDVMVSNFALDYWQKVKQEIEKL